jgi:hypothetical protein
LKAPIVLVGCGRKKLATPAPAADLYVGNLFTARRAYAERVAPDSWLIVSALYGLVRPHERIKPYDTTIDELAHLDRAAWPIVVAHELLNGLDDDARVADRVVEIHAGENYARALKLVLEAVGFTVRWPVEGLGIGEQLALYARTNESQKRKKARGCPDGSRADAGETTPVAAPSSDLVTSEPAKLDVDSAPTTAGAVS